MAELMQMLMDAAEAQEAAGDAIEGVWLRRLRSLVEHKGADWVLSSLGGNPRGELSAVQELLRRHVMDFGPEGGCVIDHCSCSHAAASRYLQRLEA